MSRTVEEIKQEQETLEETIQHEIDERCLWYTMPDKNAITIMVRRKYAATVRKLRCELYDAEMKRWMSRLYDDFFEAAETISASVEIDRSDSVQMTIEEMQHCITEAWNRIGFVNNVPFVDVPSRCRDPCLVH